MPLTLEDIAAMINSNKEEILSKVDAIVEDVKDVKTKVKDLTHRVDSQEETNAEVNKKLELLQNQMSNLNEVAETVKLLGETRLVSPSKARGTNNAPAWPAGLPSQSNQSRAGTSQDGSAVAEIMDVARRTVGLSRIDREDIERMKQPQFGGATTEEEAKILAVKEYLRCELKLNPEVIDSMVIDSIF